MFVQVRDAVLQPSLHGMWQHAERAQNCIEAARFRDVASTRCAEAGQSAPADIVEYVSGAKQITYICESVGHQFEGGLSRATVHGDTDVT